MEKLATSVTLGKLARAPARFDADDTPSECMKDTRSEILDDLAGRITSTSPKAPRIVLVCGIPGSGKSTIAKTVAIRLSHEKVLAASFFFSRYHSSRRELKLVFSTLAFQLAHYNADYNRVLSDILAKDPDLVNAAPSDQLLKLVIYPLSRVRFTGRQPWVIMLDALDECGSDHGATLLTLLSKRIAEFPAQIRLFLTGRPEDSILQTTKSAHIQPILHTHMLHEMAGSAVSDDIRVFAKRSLSGDWAKDHDWVVKEEDLDALVTRADGLFIFAAVAVKYIRGDANRHSPQSSMDFILHHVDAAGPRLLNQLYFEILNDAVPPAKDARGKQLLSQYQHLLGAVAHLQEPLSSTALSELLNMPLNDVSRVIRLLGSVLVESDSRKGTRIVRVAHVSFLEYVTDAEDQERPELFLNGPTHHATLAHSCIDRMNDKLHRNMCALDTIRTYAMNAEIENLEELVAAHIPPALHYACIYWASHLPKAGGISTGGLTKWLDTNVLFWLETLSLCKELPRALPLIIIAQRWYRDVVRFVSIAWIPHAHHILCNSLGIFIQLPLHCTFRRHSAIYHRFLQYNHTRCWAYLLLCTPLYSTLLSAIQNIQTLVGQLSASSEGCGTCLVGYAMGCPWRRQPLPLRRFHPKRDRGGCWQPRQRSDAFCRYGYPPFYIDGSHSLGIGRSRLS